MWNSQCSIVWGYHETLICRSSEQSCLAQTEGCKIHWHSFLARKSLVVWMFVLRFAVRSDRSDRSFWSCKIEVLDYNKWRGFGHISLDQKARNHRSQQLSILSNFFAKVTLSFSLFQSKTGSAAAAGCLHLCSFIIIYIYVYSPHLVTWYWWAIDMCVLCFAGSGAGSCLAELPIQCLICYIEVPGEMNLNSSGHMGLCNTYIIDHNSISKNQ
jgi:hypothetical protein